MSGRKGKSFPVPHASGKSVESGVKRMRECRGGCGFLEALKSLLRHSVSTGATSVTIRIDLEYPYLQIADNGAGIPKREIGEIGKTTFLDLITAAEEVLIETMTRSMEKSTVMKFHNKVLLLPKNTAPLERGDETFDWFQPSTSSPKEDPKAISCSGDSPRRQRDSAGTTFTLTNIQLSLMERIEQLDKKIVDQVKHFAILHYQMSITLKDIKGNKLLFGTKKAKSITEKVASIYNLDNMEFDSISKSSNNIAIEVFWGTRLHHTFAIQLVFINGEPCSSVRLLKTIKRLWRCGGKKHPVYVLCIRVKSATDGNIDVVTSDSVIKECIGVCVAKLRGAPQGDNVFGSGDESMGERSVYFRPHIMREELRKRKMEQRREEGAQSKGQPAGFPLAQPVFVPPPQREIGEVRVSRTVTPQSSRQKSPRKSATNLSVSRVRSERKYLVSEASSTFTLLSTIHNPPSARTVTQPLSASTLSFVSHLEEQASVRQEQMNFLQNSARTIDYLKEKRKADQRRIEQLERENRYLKMSQRSSADDDEPRRKRTTQFQDAGAQLGVDDSRDTAQKPIIIYNSQVTLWNGPSQPGMRNNQ